MICVSAASNFRPTTPLTATMLPRLSALLLVVVIHAVLGACSPSTPAVQGVNPASAHHRLSSSDSALVATISSFTQARVDVDSLSGVVLLARDGVPIFSRATGFANRGTGAPNRTDTKFNLASVDKYFARIAIRQLQQAGKLSMTDPVGKYLPEYPDRRVREEVTIQYLYEMRSGLPDFPGGKYKEYVARRLTLRTLDDFVALFSSDSLRFTPGTKQEYNNAGYVLLGKVIERASGQNYYEYVRQHIFSPAAMGNTGYFPPDEKARNTALPYTTDASVTGNFDSQAPTLPGRQPATSMLPYRGSSAGGGYSTAEDLLRLSRAITTHRLLNAAFTDSLFDLRQGTVSFSGWTGGSEGANAVFYMHSTGHTLIVLSNYDPPSATLFRKTFWSEWLPEWLRTNGR